MRISAVRVPPAGGPQHRGMAPKATFVQGTLSLGRKILPQPNDQRDQQQKKK